MKVYFSNRLEILLAHLKTNLFCSNTTFFTKRYLIVPNRKMGSWVSLKLAEDLKIATGFKICSIDFAFSQMTEPSLPHELALTFQLIDELGLEKSLTEYLKGKEQKVTFLAEHLAKVFHNYYQYGFSEKMGWQEELWNKVYKQKPLRFPKEELSLHLFGFPTLSPLHFSYFQKAGAFFYQLSPCKEFWSDIKGKKQVAKILEKNSDDYLKELFDNSNPLLANFGKIGRNLCALIEESSIQTEEYYVEDEPESELKRHQQQMLYNEKPQNFEEDSSIQIHSYMTPWQEVEGLYIHLVKLLQEKDLNPSDITVMAPDISHYTPFIKAVFEGKLDYKIQDVATNESTLLFSLLNLEAKRWSVPAVVEVLRSMGQWSEEELRIIGKWVEKAHIRWGYDALHTKTILKRRFPKTQFNDGRGSWKEGLNFLLRSLAVNDSIDFKESELLGKLCLKLQQLYETLLEFHDGTKLTVQKWCLKMEALDPSIDLQRICEAAPERTYPFSLIWPLIKKEICKEKNINSHLLNAITFSSFHTPLPSKVICLLGMNHDALPRKEKYGFLNLLKKGPTLSDRDKYTFLETLLLAKENLFISYLGRSPFDQTILPPSSLVEELVSDRKSSCTYLSSGCLERGKAERDGTFEQVVERERDASQGKMSAKTSTNFCDQTLKKKALEEHFSLPAKKIKPFISSFAKKPPVVTQSHFEIKKLLTAIKNPLRPYFEKKLHIKFERDFSPRSDDELKMSPLTLSSLRKEALKTPLNTILEKAKCAVGLPVGPFNTVARKKIEDEIQHFQVTDTKTLEIYAYQVGSYFLSGQIEGITHEGYFTLDKCSLKTIINHLPLFLITNLTTWRFGRDGTVKTFDFSKELLLKIVQFYANCAESFIPLYPEMVEPLLKKDVKDLKKVVEESFHEELKYILRRGPLPLDQLIEEWGPSAEELYREIYDAL